MFAEVDNATVECLETQSHVTATEIYLCWVTGSWDL
jgi:hypothetical protein